MAMDILAICSPQRTAAVANPRLQLWIVAFPHFRIGEYFLSISDMKLPVIGTIFPRRSRTSRGLSRVRRSCLIERSLTTTFIHLTNDINL